MGLQARGKKIGALEIAERIRERSPKDISVEDFLVTFFHECFMCGIEHERKKHANAPKYKFFGYYWDYRGMENGVVKVEDIENDPESEIDPGWIPVYVKE